MAGPTKKQNVVVLSVAFLIIAGSVVVTLYATGFLFGGMSSKDKGFQNVTFTDAVITCTERTEETYGDRIQNVTTDNHSSRFDNKRFLYKIFLELDLHGVNGNPVGNYFVNCFVRSSDGTIRKYDALRKDESNYQAKPDDGTNMFGMPKK